MISIFQIIIRSTIPKHFGMFENEWLLWPVDNFTSFSCNISLGKNDGSSCPKQRGWFENVHMYIRNHNNLKTQNYNRYYFVSHMYRNQKEHREQFLAIWYIINQLLRNIFIFVINLILFFRRHSSWRSWMLKQSQLWRS